MSIHESGEMYLESIHVLLKRNGQVRAVDVSEFMGYSKPSVSRAMGLLKKGGYIQVGKDGLILLTESGLAVAEKIYQRLSERRCGVGHSRRRPVVAAVPYRQSRLFSPAWTRKAADKQKRDSY